MVSPRPVARAPVQRREHRGRGVHAGRQVGDRDAGTHREALALAGQAHAAGERLHDDVVGRLVAVGAVLPEAADRAPDQRGLLGPELRRRQSQPLAHAGAEVLDHDVAFERQPPHDVDARRRLHVDHDRALVAVDGEVVGAVGTDEVRRHAAGDVAHRRLHLDDVGAEVGQHLRAERPGQHLRQIEHAHARQRRRARFRVGSAFARLRAGFAALCHLVAALFPDHSDEWNLFSRIVGQVANPVNFGRPRRIAAGARTRPRDKPRAARLYSPLNSALRFSRNAEMPSCLSRVP